MYFQLCRWDITNRLQQSIVTEPIQQYRSIAVYPGVASPVPIMVVCNLLLRADYKVKHLHLLRHLQRYTSIIHSWLSRNTKNGRLARSAGN